MAVIETMEMALWLHDLISDLDFRQAHIVVFYYSQSVIHLTKNQMIQERTKYIQFKCKSFTPTDMLTRSFLG